ncbi:hypothetical protein EVAR_35824_1 [Eumeta japonica]|uniref:Uncharacterized protein n=1 Tax=Eumeta variegata TaxID=151549 RepID=A0A4C1WXJ8_EUMVA|nr:hypothetical protein EVAR_35824_1 [Eumeta japonica]
MRGRDPELSVRDCRCLMYQAQLTFAHQECELHAYAPLMRREEIDRRSGGAPVVFLSAFELGGVGFDHEHELVNR